MYLPPVVSFHLHTEYRKELSVKKFVVSALALATLAGLANAQAVQFRIRERNNTILLDNTSGPVTAFGGAGSSTAVPAANSRTLWFIVEAQVTGVTASTSSFYGGLAGFAGSLDVPSGAGGGAFRFNAAGFNASPATFRLLGTGATLFPNSGRGIYQPYTLVRDLGEVATGVRAAGDTRIDQIVGAFGGSALAGQYSDNATAPSDATTFGLGAWQAIYTFQYDVTSLTARTLTFRTNLDGDAFNAIDLQNVPTSIAAVDTQGSYSVNIIPAPGAAALLGLGGLLVARRRRA